ncbi:hypothetical protein ACEN8I_05705 [Polaromonas sp. CT11-55]|uniref:hypothetical protein n=1 Tax=Polaromonas sp. CT11-55 TaxID=3243045 RepID=UPI0039A71EC0
MHKSLIATLALAAACGAALGQGSSGTQGGTPPPGTGGGVAVPPPAGSGIPVGEDFFRGQCMTALANLATQKLHAQLLKDKAVSAPVLASAALAPSALGASCSNACEQYAKLSHLISWAHVSPGFLSEPEHTLQMVYRNMPQPALPGQAALDSCLPQQATMNWCPPSGVGVGAGPSRIENPLDKIKVCISAGDALQQMNFTAADAAHNCARPAIVDAAERVKAERACVADAAKAEAKAAADKAAADKAAANGMAQFPKAPLVLAPAARKSP